VEVEKEMATADEILQHAINVIDNCIKQCIQKIVTARLKNLDASNRVLTELIKYLDTVTYQYRLGDALRKHVKIETPYLGHSDVSTPELRLKYIGSKMSLYSDGEIYDVPSVGVFVYEPVKIDNLTAQGVEELLRKTILLRFPVDLEIEEEPDVENTYGKYYHLEYEADSIHETDYTGHAGIKIATPIGVLEIQSFYWRVSHILTRYLTIEGNEEYFGASLRVGTWTVRKYIDPSTTIDDNLLEGGWIWLETTYPGGLSWVVAGNVYTKGEYVTDRYVREVGFFSTHSRTIWIQLR